MSTNFYEIVGWVPHVTGRSVDFCEDRATDADTGLLEGTFTDVERGQFYEVCL